MTHFVASRYIPIFFIKEVELTKNKFSPTNLQQHVAKNRAQPVRTMAAFFQLFWVDLSCRSLASMQKTCSILIRDGVAQIDSLGSISLVKNSILTIDSEKFQLIFGYGNKFSIAGDNRYNTKQGFFFLGLSYCTIRTRTNVCLRKIKIECGNCPVFSSCWNYYYYFLRMFPVRDRFTKWHPHDISVSSLKVNGW